MTVFPFSSVTARVAGLASLALVGVVHAAPFDKTLWRNGITFHVHASDHGSLNRLTVRPSGLRLKEANRPFSQTIEGGVSGAEIADLDHDGWPELYVFLSASGSGSYGEVLGWHVDKGRSLSEIYLAPLSDDPVNSEGYLGHDRFRIEGDRLVRSFPVYREGDATATPGGGTRTLRYRLVAGPAGWSLRSDSGCDR